MTDHYDHEPLAVRGEEPAASPPPGSAPGPARARPSTGRLVATAAVTSAIVAAMMATLIAVPVVRTVDQADDGQATTGEQPAQPVVDVEDLEELDLSSPVEAIAEAVLPSVARVDVPGGAGSAVVYREDGYLLTNWHVVENAEEVRVVLADGERLPAELVGGADFADLALLRVEADGLPEASFAQDQPAVGSLAVAIGSPFGFDATVTQGVVSALNRSIPTGRGGEARPLGDLVQTDAAINPGNSGGPLVNQNGEVIGINTAIFSQSMSNAGIGFAIPSTNAVTVAQRLLVDGEIGPAFLGIEGTDLDPQDAETFDIGVAQGALVADVRPGTPAAEAGLEEGDVIVAVDGRPIDSMLALAARIRISEPGTSVEIEYVRQGQNQATEIELVEQPDDLQG